MNKKTILGLLTGAAIVAATTGSYAAWDQLEATASPKTVTLRKPVTVTAQITSDFSTNSALDTAPVYEVPINVTAAEVPNGKLNSVHWEFITEVTQGSENTAVSASDVKVEVVDPTTSKTVNADNPVNPTNSAQEFKVIVIPSDTENVKNLANNDTPLTVKVTAKLANNN